MNLNQLMFPREANITDAVIDEIQLVLDQLGKGSTVSAGSLAVMIEMGSATESEIRIALRYALDQRWSLVKDSWNSEEKTERFKAGLAALKKGAHIVERWENLPAYKIKLGGATDEEIRAVIEATVVQTEA